MGDENKITKLEILVKKTAPILLVFYILVILLLFLSELGVPGIQDYFRATDQVLILLALLLLPFVILGLTQFVKTLKFKISGNEFEIDLHNVKQVIMNEMSGQASTAEQALWPILAGSDIYSSKRLKQNILIIGSKQFTSQVFFAALLINAFNEKINKKIECINIIPNGGSLKNFADVKYNWIDAYIDYTGTCIQYFNIEHRGKDVDTILKELNQYGEKIGVKFLKPLGPENNFCSEDYCLVMKKEKAKQFNIENLEDLQVHGKELILSADPEFLNRRDCYQGLLKSGIKFKEVKTCGSNNRYDLLPKNEADVFVGYETDPELDRADLSSLKDPNQFFPRYLAMPVINLNAFKQFPEIEYALSNINITTKELKKIVAKLKNNNDNIDEAIKLAKQFI